MITLCGFRQKNGKYRFYRRSIWTLFFWVPFRDKNGKSEEFDSYVEAHNWVMKCMGCKLPPLPTMNKNAHS